MAVSRRGLEGQNRDRQADGRPLSLYYSAAMQTVAIIGAGDIGATAALTLARLECARADHGSSTPAER